MRRPRISTGISSLVGLITGCCMSVPQHPATQAAKAVQEPLPKPFMISEAALPVGFPPPGPVDVVMIKQYPAFREARVDAPGSGNDDMFMSLFRHIQSNEIAMTSPVEITYREPAATQPAQPVAMAFIYRTTATGKAGSDGKIRVLDLPAQTVLSIGVRGGYTDDNFKRAIAKLEEHLASQSAKYALAGPPRYLGYNSPFVPPFMRFGEVQVPVTVH